MARTPRPSPGPSAGAGGTPRTGASAAVPAARRRGGLRGRGAKVVAQVKQLHDVYTMTHRVDASITWWMLGALVAGIAVGVGVGLLIGHPINGAVLGVVLGVLAALFVLARKAEGAAYAQLEGQPGAAGATLRTLRRGWSAEEEPVAIDPRTKDTVFRAVGRPGVVLISDGPAHRVGKLLDAERRKVVRVLPDVPVHVFQAGREADQVPLAKLPRTVMRLRPTLTAQEVTVVTKRLRSLGGVRPPIPKGMDPMRARPDRRAVRGR